MPSHYAGTPEELLALDSYIKLSRAADSVTQQINAHLHESGLTISQFGVLEALYHLGPLSVGQLGEKILKSSGNMTMVVDNLERQGLIERQRQSNDRRRIVVSLTEKGMNLVELLLPAHVQGVIQTMDALSREEQEQLAALCRKLGLAVSAYDRVTMTVEQEETLK